MNYYFTQDRTGFVKELLLLDERGRAIRNTYKIPDAWKHFGAPIRWRGEDGFMGRTRMWGDEPDANRLPYPMKLWWPLRVIAAIRLASV